jgi:hypothetical protein
VRAVSAADGHARGRGGVNDWVSLKYPEQILERKEEPTGDLPVERIARCPGARDMFVSAGICPRSGVSVPCSIVTVRRSAVEVSVQPVMDTEDGASGETRRMICSAFASPPGALTASDIYCA